MMISSRLGHFSLVAATALLWSQSITAQQTRRPFRPAFELPDNVELQQGISYREGDGAALHLDLFLPNEAESPAPIILFIPGMSAYMTEQFWRQAAYLASAGYAGAAIEYRQSQPGGWVRFPESLHDARAALEWLSDHAREFAFDSTRIGLVGASQGGYLAALLALHDDGIAIADPPTGVEIRAVALLNPALDLTDPFLRSRGPQTFPEIMLGISYDDAPEVWTNASPISHVDAQSPPFLFLHGVDDNATPYWQSIRMASRLLDHRVRAEIFTAGDGEHGFFNGPPWYGATLSAMEEFFNRTLIEGSTELTVRSEVYDDHTSAAISPDDQRIAFASERDGNLNIYVVNVDGSKLHQLTDSPEPDGGPEWSPDGSQILYEHGTMESRTLIVMKADGSERRQLLEKGTWVDGGGSWSPDGSQIAFVSTRDSNGEIFNGSVREIYTMNAGGSFLRRLTNNLAFDSAPIWSPDGERIAFVSDRDGSHDVFAMNADGTDQVNLTKNDAWDSKPAWSPDSRKIAFLSNRDGNVDLYLMNADGTDVEILADTDEGTIGNEGRPDWFRDGSRIVYGVDGKITVMEISSKTTTQIPIQWR